ncbi:MAG: RNA-binding protein [Cellulosilyticaceae bacterium]
MDWRKCANEEERIFLEQLVGCIQKSDKQYRGFATSFYQKEWMEEVIKKYLGAHVLATIQFDGGFEEAERQVACYGYEAYEESPVQVLAIGVKTGIGKPLGHRDFLGALLGLGIERSKFGDIVVTPEGAYVGVTKELAEYICWHLTSIGRYNKLTITETPREAIVMEEKQFKEILGTVQSLRADALFALAFGISRTTAVKLLQQDKGKCNGMQVKSSDTLKVGDVGTLRGYGKMRFVSINGTTKKDRIHIKIEKYI